MAVWFRGSATASTTNGGNPSIDLTTISGLRENDFVLVIGAVPTTTTTIAFPGDWTAIDEQDSSTTTRAALAYKFMGASPDTSVVFTGDGDANSSVGAIAYAFAGVDLTTPLDGVTPTFATGAANPNPPAATPNTTGAVAITAVWSRVNDTSVTAPSGYVGAASVAANADTNDVTLGVAYKFGMVSGVEEDAAGWTTWTSAQWGGWTLFLRPASGEIEKRGGATGSANNGGNITIDLTTISGLAENDVVVVFGAVPTTTTGIAWPGDWTAIDEINFGGSRGALAYKVMGATPDTSVVFTGDANANSSVAALAVAYYNVDTTTPLDGVTPTNSTASASNNPDPASITPGTDDSAVVVFSFADFSDAAATNPTHYDGQTYINSSGDSNDISMGSAWRGGRTASVAEDPGAWSSWTATIGRVGSWSIVLRKASDSPPTATSAQVLPNIEQAATGSHPHIGSAAQSLPRMRQAATVILRFTATSAQELPNITQAASGTHGNTVTASSAQVLPKITQAGTGAERFLATSAQELPGIVQSGTGALVFTGAGAQTLGGIEQAASGTPRYTAAAAQMLARLMQSASGYMLPSGAGASVLPVIQQEATLTSVGGVLIPTDIASAVLQIMGPICALDIKNGFAALQIMGPTAEIDIMGPRASMNIGSGRANLVVET